MATPARTRRATRGGPERQPASGQPDARRRRMRKTVTRPAADSSATPNTASGSTRLWLLTVASGWPAPPTAVSEPRSEEHTSELQSRVDLVCRLLLEKKKK